MKRSWSRVTAGLVIAASACSSDRALPENQAVHSVAADTIATEIELSLGAAETGESSELGRAFSGFIRERRIYVSNGVVPEVREYDRSGRLIRRIGRRGRGPGEFMNIRMIAPLGNDSLITLDMMASRITVFDSGGTYVRSFQLQIPLYGQAEWVSEYGDGFFIGWTQGFDPRRVTGTIRDSFSLALVPRDPGPDVAPYQPLATIGARWWRSPSPGSRVAVEDGPAPLIGSLNGTVLVASGDEHLIRRWDGETWRDIALAGRTWSRGYVPGTDVPARLYDQLVATTGGTMWLADSRLDPDGYRMWHVFNPDGALESIALLPATFSVWQVDADVLLGRRMTEEGAEIVEVRRLGRR